MITHQQTENLATLSEIGAVSDFKIKASSKAFNILSSSLYANKIRAIVRELSTNAYDSHVAAKKASEPFHVHLPSALEPWFSIRDYGVGLNDDEVNKIYTTYFESTKTGSNDFVGALGLGSKSPFSYTENFSVTAIKDGMKRIYTAFVNDIGVPAIAKMSEISTEEPSGVEIKFAVSNSSDFYKFKQEAEQVYKHFEIKPTISGDSTFKIPDIGFNKKDIIPGVHTLTYRQSQSIAVMGNVAYPINVPNSEQNLGSLRHLLDCDLYIRFEIGDLDFQASREGLSYIPSTIAKIKEKLREINKQIYKEIEEEAGKIENAWEKALYLGKMYYESLYCAAVIHYVKTHPQKFCKIDPVRHSFVIDSINAKVSDLEKKYNIRVNAFNHYGQQMRVLTPSLNYSDQTRYWNFNISTDICFVESDLKVGILERTKYNWRNKSVFPTEIHHVKHTRTVVCLTPSDPTKPAKYKELYEDFGCPPNWIKASQLAVKERKKSDSSRQSGAILTVGQNSRGEYTWDDSSALSDFNDSETYYYIRMNGFKSDGDYHTIDAMTLYDYITECGIPELNVTIYGVRKNVYDSVKDKKNWINVEDYAKKLVEKHQKNATFMKFFNSIVTNKLYKDKRIISSLKDKNSDFAKLQNYVINEYGIDPNNIPKYNERRISYLAIRYGIKEENCQKEYQYLNHQMNLLNKKYPLASVLGSCYNVKTEDVVHYIDLIDSSTN